VSATLRYYIKNVADFQEAWLKNAQQTNFDTARKSLDGSKFILKYEKGLQPEGFGEGYSQQEIKEILRGEEWSFPDEV